MSYNIFGVKVLNEYLVLGTYGAIGLAAYGATRGGGSKDKQSSGSGASAGSSSTPAILGGQDADEEAFIKQFLAEAQKDSK
ncbi:hypothetical protein MOBT1_000965 [Malassezia obtusa]|uniref:ATP synthase subunit K, mitochondrial n=1 Tax=Malassezia obtusa TaxID=76774 RepID=A0AAF0ISJ8_9BASI|nr:hypothetical protein MOBT1_000965 [Malassezia obtusa]